MSEQLQWINFLSMAQNCWWTWNSQTAGPGEQLSGLTGQLPGVNVCSVVAWVGQGVAQLASPQRVEVKRHFSGWGRGRKNLHNPRHTLLPEFKGQLFYPTLLLLLRGRSNLISSDSSVQFFFFFFILSALCSTHPWVEKWLTHSGHYTLCGSKLACWR